MSTTEETWLNSIPTNTEEPHQQLQYIKDRKTNEFKKIERKC